MDANPASPRAKAQCVTRKRETVIKRLAASLAEYEYWVNHAATVVAPTRGERRCEPSDQGDGQSQAHPASRLGPQDRCRALMQTGQGRGRDTSRQVDRERQP